MNIIVIIPARKSSKRLKNKNILKINGISLINRSLNFAKKIKFAKKIIITTDILSEDKTFKNKKIIFIKRPKVLAGDKSKIYKTAIYVSKYLKRNFNLKFDSFLMLQPTSPFRSLNIINKAYKEYKINKKKYSIASVCRGFKIHNRIFIIKNKKLVLKSKIDSNFKENYFVNGNFYFASLQFINKYRSFVYEKKTIPFIFKNKKLSIDIDTRKDYLLAKKMA